MSRLFRYVLGGDPKEVWEWIGVPLLILLGYFGLVMLLWWFANATPPSPPL